MARVEQLAEGVTIYLGDAREVDLPQVNHVITDPPYGARTHTGFDGVRGADGSDRQPLGYCALAPQDCGDLGARFHDMAAGWVVWMTDHTLVPHVESGLRRLGRTVFAPLPFYQAGRSVRLTGDGPCSWTDWIVVARTKALSKWGTLPGGYIAGEGWNDKARMGGKPTALMRALVSDYSRHGDLVCDPFMGAGTTGVACVQTGRRFVGVEIDPVAFDVACKRIAAELGRPRLALPEPPPRAVTHDLWPVESMA